MRIFLSVLILIFSLQSWTKADDIRDFQIEGFSLHESLLKHFSKEKIDEEINSEWSLKYNNDFIQIGVGFGKEFPLSKKLENYDEITLVLKINDKNYNIFSVAGKIFCENKQKCLEQKNDITNSLKIFFGNEILVDEYTEKHEGDNTGKSITYNTLFEMKTSGDILEVSFYDWSKKIESEKGWDDNVKVIIHSIEFSDFLKKYYN